MLYFKYLSFTLQSFTHSIIISANSDKIKLCQIKNFDSHPPTMLKTKYKL